MKKLSILLVSLSIMTTGCASKLGLADPSYDPFFDYMKVFYTNNPTTTTRTIKDPVTGQLVQVNRAEYERNSRATSVPLLGNSKYQE